MTTISARPKPNNLRIGQFAIIIGLLASITSCDNAGTTKSGKTNTAGKTTVVVTRDASITPANSYNDIFLDSSDVTKFIAAEKLSDTMADALQDFYKVRNYQYAWFASTGLIEQSFSFHSTFCTENNCDLFNQSLEKRLDKLRIEEDSTINPRDASTIKTELQITQRFLRYGIDNYKDRDLSPAKLGLFIPAKKSAILDQAAALLANNKDNKTYASINESFAALIAPLQKYEAIARAGGWPVITGSAKKIVPGASSPIIPQIKNRLRITGELAQTDTTDVFTPTLEEAIRSYQSSHGFKPTGKLSDDLVKDMNISAIARVQQLLVNMQRMRWMPTRPKGRLIMVNIPEFVVYVDSAGTNLFSMDVVVGAEGHNTTMFSGDLNEVVFSPYWNVPPSIVKKEILPAMDRDPNYLKKKNMEITGSEGGLPVIRQLPGDKNALGHVKFLFPNSFNIYMHDTPEKGFFQRSERGLSHGCIRLSDPVKMANYLLQSSPQWTPEKIQEAMHKGEEQHVRLKNPVPVIITYYTTWVDDKGTVHFVDDIYGHDRKIAEKMFSNPQ